MAVASISIRGPSADELGLPSQELGRLGKYVVLAGKNGSGKSRLLSYVHDAVNSAIQRSGGNTDTIRSNLAQYVEAEARGETIDANMRAYMAQWQSHIDSVEAVRWNGDQSKVIWFVPSAGELSNPDDMPPSTKRQHAEGLVYMPANDWPKVVVPYISTLQDKWREVTHQDWNSDAAVREHAIESYNSLNEAIEAFFGCSLGRDSNSAATLFGRPIATAKLSSGQKVALQLIVALHAQGSVMGPSILLMDEPENHLHPAALVYLLRRIEKMAPESQMWIATHSIPLLAYINSTQPTAIWAVSEGKAEYAGKRPAEVIRGLLGDDESISHLVSFMSLPYHLASNNYAYQCLLPPTTLMTSANDPQLSQIRTALDSLSCSGALSVLDYGAGKGRLVEALGAEEPSGGRVVDYIAYDPYEADMDSCRAVIASHFGSADDRYFNDVERLIATKGEGWADCVVMTNVLHEIPVAEWIALFSAGGLLARALKPTGFLLIVEDQQIPVGEMAHQHGFLLMNTNELAKLFVVSQQDRDDGNFIPYAERDGRLTAHLVGRTLFQRVSRDTRVEAITAIRDLAMTKVSGLRAAEKTYDNGMLHGLWTQQLANATLALQQV